MTDFTIFSNKNVTVSDVMRSFKNKQNVPEHESECVDEDSCRSGPELEVDEAVSVWELDAAVTAVNNDREDYPFTIPEHDRPLSDHNVDVIEQKKYSHSKMKKDNNCLEIQIKDLKGKCLIYEKKM